VFLADPTLSFVPADRDQVITIVESINQPQISIPMKPAQAAQGYLCGLRNANGTSSVFAVLHLLDSSENVVYVHDPQELRTDAYLAAEAEGLQFLESMGFMLDDVNFPNMPPDQQERTMRRVQAFSLRGPPVRPASQRAAALARFLASF
jgi:hypothetical protein